jgi:hypothetical protein
VAITATQLGLTFGGVITALDVDTALDRFERATEEGDGHAD